MNACLLALVSLSLPPGILVDRVIAVVDKEVITYGELLREVRVALVIHEDPRTAMADLPAEVLERGLDNLVNMVVIAAQARRIGDVDVSSDEVDRAAEHFASRFSSSDAYRAFLRRFDISETALKGILRRDMRNERYIAQRLKAWRMGHAANSPVRDADALARWVKELKAGVELRLLGPNGELELQ